MPKRKKSELTASQKKKIANLVLEEGWTYGEAAEKYGVHPAGIYWIAFRANGNKDPISGKKRAGNAKTPKKKAPKKVPAKAGAVKSKSKSRQATYDHNGVSMRKWKPLKIAEFGGMDTKRYYIKPHIPEAIDGLTWDEAHDAGKLRFSSCVVKKNGKIKSFACYDSLKKALNACKAHSAGKKIPSTESSTNVSLSSSKSSAPHLQIFAHAEEAFSKLIAEAVGKKEYFKVALFSKYAQKLHDIQGDA